MKDIGLSFKEERESIGVTEEEVALDLNITIAQLENLEDGNVNAFRDIFFLKELVMKYARYLNLKEDKIMDEFNDFVFNYTSRIPVEEIEQRVKEINKEEKSEHQITSPYTMPTESKLKRKLNPMVIYILSIVLLIAIAFAIIVIIKNVRNEENVAFNYVGGKYEYSE